MSMDYKLIEIATDVVVIIFIKWLHYVVSDMTNFVGKNNSTVHRRSVHLWYGAFDLRGSKSCVECVSIVSMATASCKAHAMRNPKRFRENQGSHIP